MHVHRLRADDAGNSYWSDEPITLSVQSFAPPAQEIEISEARPATQSLFLRLRAGWSEPIHPTPVVQTLICVKGRVLVTASDGEAREIGKGDIWHMADTHGAGHHTQVISTEDFEAVIVQHP